MHTPPSVYYPFQLLVSPKKAGIRLTPHLMIFSLDIAVIVTAANHAGRGS
jgi:hypothetical protein